MPRLPRYAPLFLALWLAGCADTPPRDDGALQREAMAGTEKPAPVPPPLNQSVEAATPNAVRPDIQAGTGQFIRPSALARPRPGATGPGAVTFNFENQPVQAVVKAILGDLLKQNYTIVPGVQGNVSFSTAEPVGNEEALPILETLLSWTGNALVQQNGRYVVMPAKEAVAGNLVPSLGASAPRGGLQARLFPLRYIAASEMQKLMKPFARADAVLLADPGRNVLVMAGTSEELANYQRTVSTFDVDWLRGMSVGVYSLERASVTDLMPQLDKLFGPKGDTPLAGMLRFIPIERTNALVVISTQPTYLQEVGDWIAKIDRGGGNEPQLYVYDVRNIQATDLADYLNAIYGSGGGGGDSGGRVGPGLSSSSLGTSDNANGSASGLGSTAGSFGSATTGGLGSSSGLGSSNSPFGGRGLNGSSTSGFGSSGTGSSGGLGGTISGFGNTTVGSSRQRNGSGNGNGSGTATLDNGVRIAAADGGNQLLVRARPAQWSEIQAAIERLDVAPLQVQVEARILEVTLTNDLSFGVQWYLEGLVGGNGSVTQPGNEQQEAIGGGGGNFVPLTDTAGSPSGDALYYSFVNHNMQVAIHALEQSGVTKVLSAPSVVVMNNQVAHFQVGDQIPINTTSLAGVTTTDSTLSTVSSATYIPTGVILDVQPRVNPGGLVYLEVQQQVSTASASTNQQGNPTISQRAVSTQVAVQSGQTVLLGGMIQQTESRTNTGVPYLNRIPVLGRLFGTTGRSRDRTEIIVLLTPKVVSNSVDAKEVTDEYQRKFESLAPLREGEGAGAPAPLPSTKAGTGVGAGVETMPLKH